MKAYVLGKISDNNELKVRDTLEQQDFVEKAELIYGTYDIILTVNANGTEELKSTILKNLTENFGLGPEIQTYLVMENLSEDQQTLTQE